MKRVLITGATGFIGKHLVNENFKKGYSVRALVLPDDPDRSLQTSRDIETVIGDIRDYAAVKKAASGVDTIFHCAAMVTDWGPKNLFHEVTVGGTDNICRAGVETGVSRFVDISTNDVFGIDESRIMDETFPLCPWHEPCPDSKIKAEKISWRYHREQGLPVTMV